MTAANTVVDHDQPSRRLAVRLPRPYEALVPTVGRAGVGHIANWRATAEFAEIKGPQMLMRLLFAVADEPDIDQVGYHPMMS